jgi:hypothetical protein
MGIFDSIQKAIFGEAKADTGPLRRLSRSGSCADVFGDARGRCGADLDKAVKVST